VYTNIFKNSELVKSFAPEKICFNRKASSVSDPKNETELY